MSLVMSIVRKKINMVNRKKMIMAIRTRLKI